MNGYDPFGLGNSLAEVIRKLQENSANMMQQIQENTVAFTTQTAAIMEPYQEVAATLTAVTQNINNLYAPILEQTKQFSSIYSNLALSVLQNSASAMETLLELDYPTILDIAETMEKAIPDISDFWNNFSIADITHAVENGDITEEDIAEEIEEIVSNPAEKLSFFDKWDNFKKTKWFLAIYIIYLVFSFVCQPVTDKIKENIWEATGITEFWQGSGIYEWLDNIFGISGDEDVGVLTEQEAKLSISGDSLGNISKQKREDLFAKIKEIRTFISKAPQDENTGNLLSYLSEIEKDLGGKKYGLIFEEHREEIDAVLDIHIPVLTENTDLCIDNGGPMNSLIEGDNLASLKILEKTHKGKINLIYIDPPYNTGNRDFVYDDNFVNSDDLFSHSKWLSFMNVRLKIAKRLLKEDGIIFLSIGDNELSDLKLLCDEIFGEINCLAIVPRLMKTGGNKGRFFSPNIDYVLVYAKNQFVAKDFKGALDEDICPRYYS